MTQLSLEQIARLNRRIKILEVLDHYGIDYEPDGSEERYRCKCPLHFDNSPSLKIYPETNSWYSFCCTIGFYPYDFIKMKEHDLTATVEVALKLAKLKEYDDPIEEVFDILEEDVLTSTKRQRYAGVYLISVTLRDFLIHRKSAPNYKELCLLVDEKFSKLDELLESDSTSEEDIKELLSSVVDFVKKH